MVPEISPLESQLLWLRQDSVMCSTGSKCGIDYWELVRPYGVRLKWEALEPECPPHMLALPFTGNPSHSNTHTYILIFEKEPGRPNFVPADST